MRDGEQLEIERTLDALLEKTTRSVIIHSHETYLEAFRWSDEGTIQLNVDSGYDSSSITLSNEALAEFCFSCIKEFDLIGILEKRIEGGLQ